MRGLRFMVQGLGQVRRVLGIVVLWYTKVVQDSGINSSAPNQICAQTPTQAHTIPLSSVLLNPPLGCSILLAAYNLTWLSHQDRDPTKIGLAACC